MSASLTRKSSVFSNRRECTLVYLMSSAKNVELADNLSTISAFPFFARNVFLVKRADVQRTRSSPLSSLYRANFLLTRARFFSSFTFGEVNELSSLDLSTIVSMFFLRTDFERFLVVSTWFLGFSVKDLNHDRVFLRASLGIRRTTMDLATPMIYYQLWLFL